MCTYAQFIEDFLLFENFLIIFNYHQDAYDCTKRPTNLHFILPAPPFQIFIDAGSAWPWKLKV